VTEFDDGLRRDSTLWTTQGIAVVLPPKFTPAGHGVQCVLSTSAALLGPFAAGRCRCVFSTPGNEGSRATALRVKTDAAFYFFQGAESTASLAALATAEERGITLYEDEEDEDDGYTDQGPLWPKERLKVVSASMSCGDAGRNGVDAADSWSLPANDWRAVWVDARVRSVDEKTGRFFYTVDPQSHADHDLPQSHGAAIFRVVSKRLEKAVSADDEAADDEETAYELVGLRVPRTCAEALKPWTHEAYSVSGVLGQLTERAEAAEVLRKRAELMHPGEILPTGTKVVKAQLRLQLKEFLERRGVTDPPRLDMMQHGGLFVAELASNYGGPRSLIALAKAYWLQDHFSGCMCHLERLLVLVVAAPRGDDSVSECIIQDADFIKMICLALTGPGERADLTAIARERLAAAACDCVAAVARRTTADVMRALEAFQVVQALADSFKNLVTVGQAEGSLARTLPWLGASLRCATALCRSRAMCAHFRGAGIFDIMDALDTKARSLARNPGANILRPVQEAVLNLERVRRSCSQHVAEEEEEPEYVHRHPSKLVAFEQAQLHTRIREGQVAAAVEAKHDKWLAKIAKRRKHRLEGAPTDALDEEGSDDGTEDGSENSEATSDDANSQPPTPRWAVQAPPDGRLSAAARPQVIAAHVLKLMERRVPVPLATWDRDGDKLISARAVERRQGGPRADGVPPEALPESELDELRQLELEQQSPLHQSALEATYALPSRAPPPRPSMPEPPWPAPADRAKTRAQLPCKAVPGNALRGKILHKAPPLLKSCDDRTKERIRRARRELSQDAAH